MQVKAHKFPVVSSVIVLMNTLRSSGGMAMPKIMKKPEAVQKHSLKIRLKRKMPQKDQKPDKKAKVADGKDAEVEQEQGPLCGKMVRVNAESLKKVAWGKTGKGLLV